MKYFKTKNVKGLERGTPLSAGIDFYIPEAEDFYIKLQEVDIVTGERRLSEPVHIGKSYTLTPGASVLIPSGIKALFSKEYALIAFNKSGIASKHSVIVGAAVVDPDYQGEIHIDLKNIGTSDIIINPGDKITQFILVRIGLDHIIEVDSLEKLYNESTSRGSGGFGHTGIR